MAWLPVLSNRVRSILAVFGCVAVVLLITWRQSSSSLPTVSWTSRRAPPNSTWYSTPAITALVLNHLDHQRKSHRGTGNLVFMLEHVGDETNCDGLDRVGEIVRRSGWAKAQLGGDCAASSEHEELPTDPSPNLDSVRHQIVFASVFSLDSFAASLESQQALCRDCASLLLVVHSPSNNQTIAESTLDSLLDTTNLAFLIQQDVTPFQNDGFIFSLRLQPLALQEKTSMQEFVALQTHDNRPCEELKFLVHEMMPSGFGSIVVTVSRLSYYAVHVARPLILVPNTDVAYLDNSYCPSSTFDCFFHSPLYRPHRCTSFVLQQLAALPPLEKPRATSHLKQLDPTDHRPELQFWLLEWPSWTGMDGAFYSNLHQRGLDPFAARAFLLIATPRRAVRRLLETRLANLENQAGPRYLGTHIRHGDKSTEYSLVDFTAYMKVITSLGGTTSLDTVYLATDNATIITHDIEDHPEFLFVVQEGLVRSGGESGGKGYWRKGYHTKRLELFLTTMLDLEMLSRSEAFVGSESSGFTQLVKARRLAEGGGTLATLGLGGRGEVEQAVMGPAWFDRDV